MVMRLHERLKELLKNAKKHASVARELEVGAPTLSQWLSGASICGRPYLVKIVEAYVGGSPEEKKAELLRLLLLRDAERINHDRDEHWPPSGKQLATEALGEADSLIASRTTSPGKASGRTLQDFPDSFYPLAIIAGDKREASEARINVADFGAASGSPAEIRWLMKLGLRKDVEYYGDKVTMLETPEQLRDRFGQKNLLIIGSPGSNHLARRCLLFPPRHGWRAAVPVFRFNFDPEIISQIEGFLDDISGLSPKQLVGKKDEQQTERNMSFWLRMLFTGGILDPSDHGRWTRACMIPQARDFGLISMARNPFATDDKYVSVHAAGFHMFGTAHALRMLAQPELFSAHPLGGIVRVDMNLQDEFATRFDHSTAAWDPDSDYDTAKVLAGLKLLRDNRPARVNITTDEIDKCIEFVESL